MSATQYAHALMQLAQEHNNPTLWLDYLSELAAISQDKYFIEYIISPDTTWSDIHDVLIATLNISNEPIIAQYQDQLLQVIIKAGHIMFANAIYQNYKKQYLIINNSAELLIVSANKLDDINTNKLIAEVSRLLCKNIVLSAIKIDQRLLFGYQLYIEDIIIDRSLAGELQALSMRLLTNLTPPIH